MLETRASEIDFEPRYGDCKHASAAYFGREKEEGKGPNRHAAFYVAAFVDDRFTSNFQARGNQGC